MDFVGKQTPIEMATLIGQVKGNLPLLKIFFARHKGHGIITRVNYKNVYWASTNVY